MNRNVMEMVIFQKKDEVSEAYFLQLFHELNEALKKNAAGFMKRSLTKDTAQDKWVEMIWWESMEAAKAALETIPQMEVFKQYCATLKEEGTMMLHLEKIV